MTSTSKDLSIRSSASCPPTPPTFPTPPDSSVITQRTQLLTRVPFNLRSTSLRLGTSPSPVPIQDKSYLEALGLRLNEAVSRALGHPSGPSPPSEVLSGRRPIPVGRGRALGMLIASELHAARDNRSLYRAVLRALHKPLFVLLSDLAALLLPLLSSPAFLCPPAPTLDMPTPNATQLHALAISDFAGELLLSFDDMTLGLDTDSRGDGLKTIHAGLTSLIGRVLNPLTAGIKEKLITLIDALETPAKTTLYKGKGSAHPSIIELQSLVPVYAGALTRYASTQSSHTLLALFLISIIWRALVALSHRPMVVPSSSQVVPADKGQHAPSTAPTAISTMLFNFKAGSSRSSLTMSTAVLDAKALHKILSHFPRPRTEVAQEAVDEAFAHLAALVSLLESVSNPFFAVNKTVEEITDEICDLTDELPTLIALPVLLHMQYGEVVESGARTVAALFNISEDAYRKEYLPGFGRAESYGPVVAQRVLDEISARPITDLSECFVDWLEGRVGQIEHCP